MNYIKPKNKEEEKSKDNDNDNKEVKIIKRKKYINNKRKILINNLSFDFPLEYNSDLVMNSEISKYIFIDIIY